MKKHLFSILLLSAGSAYGDFEGGKDIGSLRVHNDGRVSFGATPQAAGTCDYFGYQFSFDAATEGGKNMLSFILSAKAMNKPINIWYSPSQNPGTNQTNGCSESVLATPSSLAFQN